uniref:Uncharacterized protein n=1 Tax=Globisporangium ultimum (strain ATCC 200006 / CBS 805.95 / DAOM BR144) TaxID=431595 RepID=K3WT14_GLOUD
MHGRVPRRSSDGNACDSLEAGADFAPSRALRVDAAQSASDQDALLNGGSNDDTPAKTKKLLWRLSIWYRPWATICGQRLRARVARTSKMRLALSVVLLLVLLAALLLVVVEGLGRLRFQGYLVTHQDGNGQLGFYHEMDVDMQALRDVAQKPHGKLFPATMGNTQREVSAWFTERRQRTNGRKYLVGCTANWSGYVLRSFLHLFTELKSEHGWEDLMTRDPVDFFYKQDPQKAPSVLFFCLNSFHYRMHLFHDFNKYFQELRALGTVIMVWNDDLHYYDQFNPIEIRETIFKRADVLVGTYTYQMDEYFASITGSMNARDMPMTMWLPHSSGPDFTKSSFNEYPIHKIILSGARGSNWYPLRHWLGIFQETHRDIMDIYQHAGYYVKDNQSEIFASYLRAYRAGITTTLLFQYVIAKIFEIPSTGSLLVVNRDVVPLLEALHMKEMQHFVSFDRTDPETTMHWVLDPANQVVVDTIRKAGMELVREQHMVTNRVQALNRFVKEGVPTYTFPATFSIRGPCPSAAIPSKEECEKRFAREGLYKCDQWFCGARSIVFGK